MFTIKLNRESVLKAFKSYKSNFDGYTDGYYIYEDIIENNKIVMFDNSRVMMATDKCNTLYIIHSTFSVDTTQFSDEFTISINFTIYKQSDENENSLEEVFKFSTNDFKGGIVE